MTATVGATVLAVLLGGSAEAPGAKASPDLSTELVKLNKAVREIADLLAKQAEGQKLDLLMKRIEMTSSKVAQLEQRVRGIHAERDGAEEEARQLEMQTRQAQDAMSAQTDETRRTELSTSLERLDAAVKRATARGDSLSQELVEVENQLAAQRRELAEWQRVVDRRLGAF